MMRALGQHDEVIDAAVEAHNGISVKHRGEGDSRFVVFPAAADAVNAAAAIQSGRGSRVWDALVGVAPECRYVLVVVRDVA